MARFVSGPETFVVEEIPAYRPAGAGEHTYCWIEKRDLTTHEAVRRLARALGVAGARRGVRGAKDRHAITRQWLSLPGIDARGGGGRGADGAARAGGGPARQQAAHGAPEGQSLRGRADRGEADEAGADRRRLAALAETGVPNRFGAAALRRRGRQRRGGAGGAAAAAARARSAAARAAVFGAAVGGVQPGARAAGRARRPAAACCAGDVLKKTRHGRAVRDRRSGRRCGPGRRRARWCRPGPCRATARSSRRRERGAGAGGRGHGGRRGGRARSSAALGRALPGARRPVVVPLALGTPPVEGRTGEGRVRLRFGLPAGSYATVLLEALGVTDPGAATGVGAGHGGPGGGAIPDAREGVPEAARRGPEGFRRPRRLQAGFHEGFHEGVPRGARGGERGMTRGAPRLKLC